MVACTADKPRTNLNWWFGHGAFCLQGRAIRVPLRTWLSSATGPKAGRATTAKPGTGFFGGLAVAKVTPAVSLLPLRRRSCLLLARKSLVHWRERPAGSRPVKNQAHSGTRTASIKKKLMNNQNLNTEPAPANAVQTSSCAVRDFAAEKARAVATLAEFRRSWRSLVQRGASHEVLAGFKDGVCIALRHLEMATPEWELWTTLPDEAELTSQSRIGDHVAVTRQLLGYLV